MNVVASQRVDRAETDGIRYKLLTGTGFAAETAVELQPRVAELIQAGWPPRLLSLSIGHSDAAELYVRNQRRAAERIGIEFENRVFPAEIDREEVLGAVRVLNVDPRVTGVIIQRPVPVHVSIRELQGAVHPLKDVEGMHPASIGNIVYNDLLMGPCTSVASVELLKRTGLRLEGLEVVIIGHSEIVGKPIAFLLMNEGCTVTVCHHMTRNLQVHSRTADAVFVAVGKPRLLTGAMIKPGAAVIDIGINQIDTPAGPKVVGDVDFESCAEVAGWITPVPGGVGPATTAVLMRNTVLAATLQRDHYAKQFGAT